MYSGKTATKIKVCFKNRCLTNFNFAHLLAVARHVMAVYPTQPLPTNPQNVISKCVQLYIFAAFLQPPNYCN